MAHNCQKLTQNSFWIQFNLDLNQYPVLEMGEVPEASILKISKNFKENARGGVHFFSKVAGLQIAASTLHNQIMDLYLFYETYKLFRD